MLKAYKTEINPNENQIELIHKTIGTCRYIYNLYLQTSKEQYEKTPLSYLVMIFLSG